MSAAVAVLLLYVPAALLRGVVLHDLWAWFVTPLGVPGIGVVQAVGLAMIVSFLTLDANSAREGHNAIEGFAVSIVITLIVWGFGALWALFL